VGSPNSASSRELLSSGATGGSGGHGKIGASHARVDGSERGASGWSGSREEAEATKDHAKTSGRTLKGTPHRAQAGKREGPSKNRVRDQAKAEQSVERAEAALRMLEDELADPAAWATKYEAAKSEARHTAAKRDVEAAYERLESLID
jgi:ATP-binding cassette, subfamily F, member 3